MDPVLLRARIGMVFQKADLFPKSIYDNVVYVPRLHGLVRNKSEHDEILVTSIRQHFEPLSDFFIPREYRLQRTN